MNGRKSLISRRYSAQKSRLTQPRLPIWSRIMSLWPISELVQHARKHHYALGYFESWNLESLQGVLDAAEMTGSPIIIGFNGEFLSRPGRKLTERIRCYAELGKA